MSSTKRPLKRASRAGDRGALWRAVLADGVLLLIVAGGAWLEWDARRGGKLVLAAPAVAVVAVVRIGAEWLRQRRFRIGRATWPTEPWNWDHRWDREGQETQFDRTRTGWTQLLWALGFVVLAVQFAVFVPAWPLAVILAVPASGLAWFGYRNLRGGGLRLTAAEFPQFVGSRATFLLGVTAGGARFEEAVVVLRCVQEHRRGEPRFETVWEQSRELDPDMLPGPGNDVRVQFDVPATARGTQIDVREPRWWEVDVMGQTDGGPIHERFVVPIYERPEPPAADPVPA